ncbi:MAG: STAS domain-containing protein [Kiritimatiellaeota bacterium]|nr:STAS domain-containing protein [Kiritimatiellota bacterium]
MSVNIEVQQGISVVQLSGTLTSANSCGMVAQFAGWLDRHNPMRCVFDLGKLEILDSSGIGSMVTCLHKVKKLDGELCIAAAQGRTATVLAIARLDLIFKTYPTVEAAIAALSTSA